MLDNKERFEIAGFGKKSTFASFLPGISGKYGIPIWCHYVNRGQCITSFGIEDKDHAIMEFFPAHKAYQNVKKLGFRTFIKKNGKYIEPFNNEDISNKMTIGMNELEIVEMDDKNEIETKVRYSTLPNERVGALVRKVTIRNLALADTSLEILDGMPALIPYGINMDSMKNMGQTCKAWMQVEDVDKKIPYYRVRVSMEDTAAVTEVIGGNFGFSIMDNGEILSPIVDTELVFDYDTTLDKAEGFAKRNLDELLLDEQVTQNYLPCCFFAKKISLKAGEAITIYEVYGQVESKDVLNLFIAKCNNATYFEQKYKEAVQLTEELCTVIDTKTSNKLFDCYCKQTYLDNVLRGGYPIVLGKDKIFYLYSRKHGDVERDYNYFKLLPEYYSQGNGNFRDVNQNRRSDVMFTLYVGNDNIKTFYNLIQIDGYNPLSVDKITYKVNESDIKRISMFVGKKDRENLCRFLNSSFTPGSLLMEAQNYQLENCDSIEQFFCYVIDASEKEINGTFSEGYWSDHWTYNLDLIESYLNIYPDKEEELLFGDNSYTYFETQVMVYPRNKRYVKTNLGIRQYNFLDTEKKKKCKNKCLKSEFGKGEVVTSILIEKILLLNTIKFATLDPYGMGIEMEGGKPGWYDALNGLPGIFGSSMAETYELSRLLNFTIQKLKKFKHSVAVIVELAELIEVLYKITREENNRLCDNEVLDFWNKINNAKEEYRAKTVYGVSGDKIELTSMYLIHVLELWNQIVKIGIQKAISYGNGICPTYFSYEVTEFIENGDEIEPMLFKVNSMPLFLEGPTRFLKLDHDKEQKKKLYVQIKESDLYDNKLFMYKINENLSKASFEIGRTKAFTSGWLENESIWLHMEYKYLLELLKSGLYDEFNEDFEKACIPFLDSDTYGRSTLENSSFIASSVNPNKKLHGKGYVARLSGSTAEFINIWNIMMFGKKPFRYIDGKLILIFEPAIPKYLIDSKRMITVKFLGKVSVIYHLSNEKALIPGTYTVKTMEIMYLNGKKEIISSNVLNHTIAMDIRDGKVSSILLEVDNQ